MKTTESVILSETKNLIQSRGYRPFTEPVLSEILQSLSLLQNNSKRRVQGDTSITFARASLLRTLSSLYYSEKVIIIIRRDVTEYIYSKMSAALELIVSTLCFKFKNSLN